MQSQDRYNIMKGRESTPKSQITENNRERCNFGPGWGGIHLKKQCSITSMSSQITYQQLGQHNSANVLSILLFNHVTSKSESSVQAKMSDYKIHWFSVSIFSLTCVLHNEIDVFETVAISWLSHCLPAYSPYLTGYTLANKLPTHLSLFANLFKPTLLALFLIASRIFSCFYKKGINWVHRGLQIFVITQIKQWTLSITVNIS